MFKQGDRVKIRSNSQFFGCGSSNPINVEGTIIDIDDSSLPYIVRWDNGTENGYFDEDLELVQSVELNINLW